MIERNTNWHKWLTRDDWRELSDACDHQETEVRRRRIRDGRTQYRQQCKRCGKSIGGAVSKKELRGETLEFDEVAEQRFMNDMAARRKRRAEQRREQWFAEYNQYLQSDEWATRREKVMKRAGGVCEGCRENRATQVHHLTYDNVGRELLFELVAICDDCHEIAHSGGEEE